MNRYKDKIIKLSPFFLFFCIMVFRHLKYSCVYDDADLIANTLKDNVWQEFSSVVYNFTSWSSRVLVNLPIHILLHFDFRVWMCIEFVLLMGMMKAFAYIFNVEDSVWKNYVLVGLLFLFPFDYVIMAGWITTTATYLWPIAIAVISCTSIRKFYDNEKIPWYMTILYFLGIIYAANHEQMSVLLCVIFGTVFVLMIKDRKLNIAIVLQTVAAFANLAFHALTPGNGARSIAEAGRMYPDFETLSLVDRIEVGFSSSVYEFFLRYNKEMLAVGFIILAAVWQKHKNWFFRFIGAIPFLAQGFFGVCINRILESKMHIAIFDNRLFKNGTILESNYYVWTSYYAIVCLILSCIGMVAALYLVFGNSKKSIIAIAIFVGGLGGRMVMAFSPTLWGSSMRTYTEFYFAMITIGMMCLAEVDSVKKEQNSKQEKKKYNEKMA